MEQHYSRNIIRLYIIKTAKWFMLTMPIIMLFYKDMGLSHEQSFQLKAIYSISVVIFEVPSGYLADILGRRITLILGAILGTLGFLFYSIGGGFWMFLAAEMTLGIGQSFVSGADSAMLFDSLKSDGRSHQYLKYEGINYSIGNYSEALAGLAGGALAEISLHLPFYFQTGIAFLAVPAAFTLLEPPSKQKPGRPGFRDILKVVHYALVKNIRLRWNLIYSSIIGTSTLTMAWVYQLRLDEFGFKEIFIGGTATALNILVGTVTLFSSRLERKMGKKITVMTTSLLITGGFVAGGLTHQAFFFLLLLGIFYMARGVATPVLKDYINQITPSEIRATVLSVRNLLIRALFAVIAPLFGWLSDKLSLAQALLIVGLVFMALALSTVSLFLNTLKNY
ncbi:MFS transporter [Anaerophaga thermohalophila]|uniref:MFS transporter n=1 Tax=Anaerophaga thermohalophila TaxID=177400 RepID=UPI000237C23D|nr:MFS transporter [Anaerophaga thermohalophila]